MQLRKSIPLANSQWLKNESFNPYNIFMIIIFGVSGSGKTTIGKLLAKNIDAPFYDADDFHPLSNIYKMKQGIALNDKDRLPWLKTLSKKIEEWNNKREAILSCSALKEKYRKILTGKTKNIKWVFLNGNFELIQNRIQNRSNHFMSAQLLRSQFETLEIHENAISVNIESSPNEIVKEIISKIKL